MIFLVLADPGEGALGIHIPPTPGLIFFQFPAVSLEGGGMAKI